ncbi:MAG: 3-hydroxyacyl-ACP dehydratase FabZ [Deltaproteobacteria bacterium]|nr:3-hydroxyacyl-ACP dehydratase FabZ [Deltaproteobacteria bacterium]
MDLGGILDCLPHRYPFLLVDRVLKLEPGSEIHAIKNVTANESFFQGHFPGNPIMPGVLIIEALAQTGGILAIRTAGTSVNGKLVVFRSIDGAKFRRTVVPGDRLDLHAKVQRTRQGLWTFESAARVDGELVVEAVLSAAILDREGAT